MQISITGRHVEVTEAIKEYAREKLENCMSEFPRVENVHMILDVEKYRHFAEVVVQGKDHIHVDAKEESEDMYASIDIAVDKAHRQLRKHRDKVQDHRSKERLADVEQEMQELQNLADGLE